MRTSPGRTGRRKAPSSLSPKTPASSHGRLMVVVIYANIVLRLRFGYALACSVTILTMHIGGVLMVPAFNDRLILPVISVVGASVVFTMMANYAMERDERKRYLLALRQKHLLRELDEVHHRLQNRVHVDVLTGAYNRRHLQEYLRQTWRRAQHGQGEVAEVMRSCLRRPGDLVARNGGDEFIAVLPQTSAELAQQAAKLIAAADAALYQAKHGGRNRVRLAATMRPGISRA